MRFVNCFSIKTLSMFVIIALFLTLPVQNSMGVQKADAVLVVKSDKRLYLMNKGEKFASFRVTFGDNPKGQKQKRGDERTPEGCR